MLDAGRRRVAFGAGHRHLPGRTRTRRRSPTSSWSSRREGRRDGSPRRWRIGGQIAHTASASFSGAATPGPSISIPLPPAASNRRRPVPVSRPPPRQQPPRPQPAAAPMLSGRRQRENAPHSKYLQDLLVLTKCSHSPPLIYTQLHNCIGSSHRVVFSFVPHRASVAPQNATPTTPLSKRTPASPPLAEMKNKLGLLAVPEMANGTMVPVVPLVRPTTRFRFGALCRWSIARGRRRDIRPETSSSPRSQTPSRAHPAAVAASPSGLLRRRQGRPDDRTVAQCEWWPRTATVPISSPGSAASTWTASAPGRQPRPLLLGNLTRAPRCAADPRR